VTSASPASRDPAQGRVSLLGDGARGSALAWLLRRLRRSPLGWRVNFTVRARYGERTVKLPISKGQGYQNLEIGEAWLLRAFERLLASRDGAFVDVGVNLGQTLLKVKLLDPQREYVGFEPNPQCCEYVAQLIALNRFERCRLIPAGLSDTNRIVMLFRRSDEVDPSASLVPGFRESERYHTSSPVSVVRADEVLRDLNDVAIIKIDVEGGELEVIRGAIDTIARCAPYIFCEILPVFDPASATGVFRTRRQAALLQTLRPMGYVLFRIGADDSLTELRGIEPHGDLSRCNYVLVPRSRLPSFREIFAGAVQTAGGGMDAARPAAALPARPMARSVQR
jgi:FkbM family methyltransferase